MALIDDVRRLLRARFPGARLQLENVPPDRVGGSLVWDEFGGVPQIDRQTQLRNVIDSLPVGQQLRVSFILTLTKDERAALATA